MQDLHRDPPAVLVHPIGDPPVIGDIRRSEEPRRPRQHPALGIGRHAPRHHQRHPAPRPLGIEFRHPVPVAQLLEPGMHRAHQHPVRQRDMTEIERREQMGVGGLGHGGTFRGTGGIVADMPPPVTRPQAPRRDVTRSRVSEAAGQCLLEARGPNHTPARNQAKGAGPAPARPSGLALRHHKRRAQATDAPRP